MLHYRLRYLAATIRTAAWVPARSPPHEIMRAIVDRREDVELERDPEPEPIAPEQAAEPSREPARDLLAELDELKAQVAALDSKVIG